MCSLSHCGLYRPEVSLGYSKVQKSLILCEIIILTPVFSQNERQRKKMASWNIQVGRSEPAMAETKGSLPLLCQMSSKDLLSTSTDSSYLEIVRIKGHYLTFQEPYLKKFNLYTLCINFASSKISLSQKEQKSQPLSGIKSLSFCFHHIWHCGGYDVL